jgi:hypothetical protein
MSIKSLLFFSSLLLLSSGSASFASGALEHEAESPAQATRSPQPKISFKNFTFDPETKQFEGGIFNEAQVVAGELGAYYTGKYQAVQKQLDLARDHLNVLKQKFNAERYKTLKQHKIECPPEEFKQSEAYEAYKQLRAQQGEILLQENAIKDLNLKSQAYNQYREAMSSLPHMLQQVFYLTYLQPEAIYISSSGYYHYKYPIAIETQHIDLQNIEHHIRNLTTAPSADTIKPLQKEGSLVFDFLKRRAYNFQEREIKPAQEAREFFKLQEAKEMKEFVFLLPTDMPKVELYKKFIAYQKKVTIKQLRAYKKKLENEITPLAQFYNGTIEALKTFQQEVKELKAS